MRVIVPAIITGTGEEKTGTISKVETFLGKTIVSVSYDTPDHLGNWGSTITNTSALKIMAKKSEDNNILPQVEEFLKFKQQYPDRILLIDNVSREKGYVAYGEDAVAISKLLGMPLEKGGQTEQGMEKVWLSANDAEKVIKQLMRNRLKAATIENPQKNEKEVEKPQLITINGDRVTHVSIDQGTRNLVSVC